MKLGLRRQWFEGQYRRVWRWPELRWLLDNQFGGNKKSFDKSEDQFMVTRKNDEEDIGETSTGEKEAVGSEEGVEEPRLWETGDEEQTLDTHDTTMEVVVPQNQRKEKEKQKNGEEEAGLERNRRKENEFKGKENVPGEVPICADEDGGDTRYSESTFAIDFGEDGGRCGRRPPWLVALNPSKKRRGRVQKMAAGSCESGGGPGGDYTGKREVLGEVGLRLRGVAGRPQWEKEGGHRASLVDKGEGGEQGEDKVQGGVWGGESAGRPPWRWQWRRQRGVKRRKQGEKSGKLTAGGDLHGGFMGVGGGSTVGGGRIGKKTWSLLEGSWSEGVGNCWCCEGKVMGERVIGLVIWVRVYWVCELKIPGGWSKWVNNQVGPRL